MYSIRIQYSIFSLITLYVNCLSGMGKRLSRHHRAQKLT